MNDTVQIVSFGYSWGQPPNCEVLVDCRGIVNPYHDAVLREYDGTHYLVQRMIAEDPNAEAVLVRLEEAVENGLRNVGLGCLAGHHRSVALGEALSKRLIQRGYNTRVIHRDKGRWLN